MNMKKILGIFLLFLFTITIVSCADDKDTTEVNHLSFEKDYYERPLLRAKNIMVRGGNRDYTIKVENTDILGVEIDLSSSEGMGDLKVLPKQKGETNVEVQDNVTKEIVNLKIKIVDSYLNLAVANPTKPPYKQGNEFFLINNDSKDFYLYDENSELKHTGSYKFYIENNVPYMELVYHKEFEGRTTYKYDLTGTSETMFQGIKYILNWERHTLNKCVTTKEVSPVTMNVTDTKTNETSYFILSTHDIPEHVLE